jgi:hypothetical protein
VLHRHRLSQPHCTRSDNILALELDMPERLSCELGPDGPSDSRAQAAIDAAYWDDGHVLLLGPRGSPQQQLHLVSADMSGYAMQQQQPALGASFKQQPHPSQRPGSASRRQPGAQSAVR